MLKLEKLNSLKTLDKNPRTITQSNLDELVDSIISFPQMLSFRPIVISSKKDIIGGNMRVRALKEILKLDATGFARRFATLPYIDDITETQRAIIFAWFTDFFKTKSIPVIHASELTEAQIKEFVIKDNTHFGRWDSDKLANEWDDAKLKDWGVNIDFGDVRIDKDMNTSSGGNEAIRDKDFSNGDGLSSGDSGNNSEGNESHEGTKSMILEFSPEDYEKVNNEIKRRGGIAEGVFMGLLGI